MGYEMRPSFLQNAITGQILMLAGCRPSSRRPVGSTRYQSQRFGSRELPSKVDLRPHMTRVEDQAQLNSCSANAIAGAYEYLTKRAHGQAEDMSRLFLYYNARRIDGIRGDRGCSLTGSIDALYQAGVCHEATWPYHQERVNHRPPQSAYAEGEKFRLKEAQRLQTDLFEMKHCLAEGYPFVFGMALFESFDRAEVDGRVPMPRRGRDSGRSSHGFHAMLAVGYSEANKAFLVRNSWGESWGDGGYCYVPYAYMTNPEYVFESWTIRSVEDLDLGDDDWEDDDTGFFDDEEDADAWSDDDWSDDETNWEAVSYDDAFEEPHYGNDLISVLFNVLFDPSTNQWSEGDEWEDDVDADHLEQALHDEDWDDEGDWDDEEWSSDGSYEDDEVYDEYEQYEGDEDEWDDEGDPDNDPDVEYEYGDDQWSDDNPPPETVEAGDVLGALLGVLVDVVEASADGDEYGDDEVEDEWEDDDSW